jgi:hypothetical protein
MSSRIRDLAAITAATLVGLLLSAAAGTWVVSPDAGEPAAAAPTVAAALYTPR